MSKRFTVFTIMWVLAIFFHMIHRSDIVSGIFPALTILAGCYVLLNPSDEKRLLLFSFFHICVYIIHAPNTSNHAFFAFCIDLSILAVFGLNLLNTKSNRDDFFNNLIPVIKSFTIILYFFAVFHKLNWNYLDPSSCGGSILIDRFLNNRAALTIFGVLSEETIVNLKFFNIYSSLILETLIPILLLWRRFAWIGCLLGVVLHGTLGFVYFWHFTPLLYALYILFLPDAFFDKIHEFYQGGKILPKALKCGVSALIVIVPILYISKFYFPILEQELGAFSRNSGKGWTLGFNIRTIIGWFPFLLYTLLFICFILFFARGGVSEPRTKLPIPYYIFPLIVVINGFSPYLGLKTHQSFSMFSGLLTHGTTNNHVFMPTINIIDTQKDVVTPFSEYHTNYVKKLNWENDEKLVYYELQKRVTKLKRNGVTDIELHFLKNGDEVHISNAESDPNLIIPLTWIDKKFRTFREIPMDPYGCYY